jgi:hypothetical protein
MLMTSHPAALNQADSARVENLGPSITTTVPRSCRGIDWRRPSSMATRRIVGQYGSAKEMWVVTGPS